MGEGTVLKYSDRVGNKLVFQHFGDNLLLLDNLHLRHGGNICWWLPESIFSDSLSIESTTMAIGMIIGCRLCLCTDPRKSFTFLDFSKQEKGFDTESLTASQSLDSKSLLVKSLAGLEVDFSLLDIFPNHVCDECWQEVQRLDRFKKMAQGNERFIMQCQEDIKSVGLLKAKEKFDVSPSQSSYATVLKEEEDSLQKEAFQGTEEDKEEDKADYEEKGGVEDDDLNDRLEDCFDKVVDDKVEMEGDKVEMKGCFDEVEDLLKCKICQKHFSSTRVRLKHEREIHSTKCTECNICGKSVKHLKYHMQTKHPEIHQLSARGVCIFCNQDCENLRKHEQIHHTNVDSMRCRVCFKVFLKAKTGKLKAIVKQHIKLNHNLESTKKPCPLCEKMYADVNYHMRSTHSIEKAKCPFDDCKQVCKNKIRLKQHMRNIHTDRKPKVCPQCGDTYRYSLVFTAFVFVFAIKNPPSVAAPITRGSNAHPPWTNRWRGLAMCATRNFHRR